MNQDFFNRKFSLSMPRPWILTRYCLFVNSFILNQHNSHEYSNNAWNFIFNSSCILLLNKVTDVVANVIWHIIFKNLYFRVFVRNRKSNSLICTSFINLNSKVFKILSWAEKEAPLNAPLKVYKQRHKNCHALFEWPLLKVIWNIIILYKIIYKL